MIWTMVTSILDLLRYMDYIPNIYTVPRRNKAFFECKCSLELPLVVVRRSGILLVATTSASSLSHSMTPIIQMPGAPEIPRRLKKPWRACRCEPNISMWLGYMLKTTAHLFPKWSLILCKIYLYIFQRSVGEMTWTDDWTSDDFPAKCHPPNFSLQHKEELSRHC